jgi:hypothetical protein
MKTREDLTTESQKEWLNRVVKAWCFHTTAPPHPKDALTKIERYGSMLHPDPKTYGLILNAVLNKVERRQAPILAESILDEILDRAESKGGAMPNILR